MKRARLSFALLSSAVFLLTSCLKDDDKNVTYYEDTAITAFSVGTLKWSVDSVTKAGKDTVYQKKLEGKKYAFYIDQLKREVYNPDSLPYGVDGKKVLCTITSRNAGIVLLKSATSDSMKYYSNTDSIDFSQPRTFRVYSNSRQQYRDYTIRVNVHKQKPNDFKWTKLTEEPALAALTAMKAVVAKGKIYVFGKTGGGTKIYASATNDGKTWTQIVPTGLTLDADAYKNVAVQGDTLFLWNGGRLLKSVDATTWTTIPTTGSAPQQLLGVSHSGFCFLGTDNLLYTLKRGETEPTRETLNSDAAYLPVQDISFVALPALANDSTDQLLLFGNRTVDVKHPESTAMVWGKVAEYSKKATTTTQHWTRYIGLNPNLLPRLTHLQVVAYGRYLLAIGGDPLVGSKPAAFSQMYFSKDGGVTWYNNKIYTLPSTLNSSHTSFAMTVDADNYIWLVCGDSGQVWKVRKNSMGWTIPQTSFTK